MTYTFNDLIEKKKHKQELTYKELQWLVDNYLNHNVKDYQMSAMLMAIWFNQMSVEETINLTKVYIETGQVYDLTTIPGLKADKHSTGGVGDKTTLVLSPILASYGVNVCKMSGRGLGLTGGTIDKLEACPGWTGELSEQAFIKVIKQTHISVISQSPDIAPADKMIYALRDVAGSADSIPLIAASIMSKKLAIHTDSLVLDVKVGSGAFMQTIDDAKQLAGLMVKIAKAYQRKISVIISNMAKPLGRTIGNALEVKEAWDTLNGQGVNDFIETVAVAGAISLVNLKLFDDLNTAIKDVKHKLSSKQAAPFLKAFIEAQHGDFSVIENYAKHFTTKHNIEIKANQSGYLIQQDAASLGWLSMDLGAGRHTKDDVIDFAAGICLHKKVGDRVEKGETIMTLHTNLPIDKHWIHKAQQSLVIGATKNDSWDYIVI